MVPGASFGECCTAPVAIRMVKCQLSCRGRRRRKKKKCMETPLARHQSATQVNSEFQIIKNIEDLKESGGFRKIAGQRVVRMEVLALTYLLLGAGLNGKKLR